MLYFSGDIQWFQNSTQQVSFQIQYQLLQNILWVLGGFLEHEQNRRRRPRVLLVSVNLWRTHIHSAECVNAPSATTTASTGSVSMVTAGNE